MRQYGEGFKQMVDPMTGRPIPNSPLVSVTKGGNGVGIVYMNPHEPTPAPLDRQADTQPQRK